jgi:hypothetical protein
MSVPRARPAGRPEERQEVLTGEATPRFVSRTIASGLLVAFCALLMFLAAPRPAGAAIYWTDIDAGTIGRASLDGKNVGRDFIHDPVSPWDIVANDRHLFWSDVNRGTVSRSRLNGRGLIRSFLELPPWWTPDPRGLAVDRYHLYWTQPSVFLGRSRIDGRKAQPRFVDTRSGGVSGVAVSGRHLYWTSNEPAFDPPARVGRSRVDGSRVDKQFIRSATGPGDVTRRRGYIYWVNSNTESISRARLDGTGLRRRFIRTGDGVVSSVAVTGGFIYWTDYIRKTIGRARLDGSGVRRSFIRVGGTRGGLRGIAVVPERRAPSGGGRG